MRTIYLDLDGTILDVKQRLCAIYLDAIKELGGRALPVETYWQAKRTHLAEETIARYSDLKDTRRYTRLRIDKLEASIYLNYDRLLPLALESLENLRSNNRLVLVTMRRHRERLNHQLRRLAVRPLLNKVLLRGCEGDGTKVDMIRSDIGVGLSSCIIVGDTESDILAGKSLGMSTVAVLSGIRNRNTLVRCCPDRIIEDISQLAGCKINEQEI